MKHNTWLDKLAALGCAGAGICSGPQTEAQAVLVFDGPGTAVGFRNGDAASYTLSGIPSAQPLKLLTTSNYFGANFNSRGVLFGPQAATFVLKKYNQLTFVKRTNAGKAFSQVGTIATNTALRVVYFQQRPLGRSTFNGSFDTETKYFAFRFNQAGAGTRYGWIAARGGVDLNNPNNTWVEILQYAYATTGAQLPMGSFEPVPEPTALVPAAVLALGAVGLRQWRRAKAGNAKTGAPTAVSPA